MQTMMVPSRFVLLLVVVVASAWSVAVEANQITKAEFDALCQQQSQAVWTQLSAARTQAQDFGSWVHGLAAPVWLASGFSVSPFNQTQYTQKLISGKYNKVFHAVYWVDSVNGTTNQLPFSRAAWEQTYNANIVSSASGGTAIEADQTWYLPLTNSWPYDPRNAYPFGLDLWPTFNTMLSAATCLQFLGFGVNPAPSPSISWLLPVLSTTTTPTTEACLPNMVGVLVFSFPAAHALNATNATGPIQITMYDVTNSSVPIFLGVQGMQDSIDGNQNFTVAASFANRNYEIVCSPAPGYVSSASRVHTPFFVISTAIVLLCVSWPFAIESMTMN